MSVKRIEKVSWGVGSDVSWKMRIRDERGVQFAEVDTAVWPRGTAVRTAKRWSTCRGAQCSINIKQDSRL